MSLKNKLEESSDLKLANKALLISFVLSHIQILNLKTWLHQLKVSKDKNHKRVYKEKVKHVTNIIREHNQLYAGIDKLFSDEEIELLKEQIENGTSILYS